MKRVIYCFLQLLLCPALICACQKTPPDRAACFAQPFTAEINGEINGTPFTAKIVGSGKSRAFSICYLTPEILENVALYASLKADGTPQGEVMLTRGDLTVSQSGEAMKGLLLPLTALVSLANAEAATVQRNANGYAYTFSDASALATDENGIPKSLSAQNLSYQIIWWEQ